MHDGARYGVYGRFDSASVGGGPICVKPWSAGKDNGGATHQGVDGRQGHGGRGGPQRAPAPGAGERAHDDAAEPGDASLGAYPDAINDHLQPLMEYYETWDATSRSIVIESSGDDEAAQRADAVKIRAEKPFAVLDMNPTGLDVLDAETREVEDPGVGVLRVDLAKRLRRRPIAGARPTRRRLR